MVFVCENAVKKSTRCPVMVCYVSDIPRSSDDCGDWGLATLDDERSLSRTTAGFVVTISSPRISLAAPSHSAETYTAQRLKFHTVQTETHNTQYTTLSFLEDNNKQTFMAHIAN